MKKSLRAALQIGVSVALIAALLFVARRHQVFERIAHVPPGPVLLAGAVMALAWLINSIRWGMLLRVLGVTEAPATLAAVYFIGVFCSQLLPTGAGGDAVRMWDIARRRGHATEVVVATLQERLLGMGVSMLVGLIAAVFYFDRLPAATRLPLLGVPAGLIVLVVIFLYPRVPLAIGGALWRWITRRAGIGRFALRIGQKPLAMRAVTALRTASEVPPLTPVKLVPTFLVTLTSTLLSILIFKVLCWGVGVELAYGALCMIVPLVGVISMTPSLGGAGVREGALVVLMALFSIPTGQSLTVAALNLILQTALAGIGGILLVHRISTGTWKRRGEVNVPQAVSSAQ